MKYVATFLLTLSLTLPLWADGKAPTDEASLAVGAKLFKRTCAPCHGKEGKGDGPAAAGIKPPPRDLTTAPLIQGESDQDIFNTISNGVPKSGMAGFAKQLKEEDRWKIVSFVKTLRKK